MLELIGALGGALFRIAPLFIDLFKAKQDNAHELALLAANIELERQRGINRAQEIEKMTEQGENLAWANGLVEAIKEATPPPLDDKGNLWINLLNGLNSSVRPLMTYWWCIVTYTGAKVVMVGSAIQSNAALSEFAPILLTDFDRGIVGSIIGFWFVDRTLRQQGK